MRLRFPSLRREPSDEPALPTSSRQPGAIAHQPRPQFRALTREIKDTSSPVRRFFDDRFTSGLRDMQSRFRQAAPPLTVSPVPRAEADPGTVETAADWLLRFMVCPDPSADLALAGAACIGPRMMRAVASLAALLGARLRPYAGGVASPGPDDYDQDFHAAFTEISDLLAPAGTQAQPQAGFTGPVSGSSMDPDLLARGCWALALATEAVRSAQAAAMGPLASFRGSRLVTADDLLALADTRPAALAQLAGFRRVFETALLPPLAARPGPWSLGPVFSGSALIGGADGDLIAAGLLVDLKTSAKLTLTVNDLFQVIGYALLDFDDDYKLTELGIFSARYAYLATWNLGELLADLAGHPVSLQATRQEFRQLLS